MRKESGPGGRGLTAGASNPRPQNGGCAMQAHETSQGTTPPAGHAPYDATTSPPAQGRWAATLAALSLQDRARLEEAWRELGAALARLGRQLGDAVREEWGEGCTIADVLDLAAGPPDERNPALHRLAGPLAVRWHVYDPAARAALAERAEQVGGLEVAKRSAAATGLVLAAADAHRPQAVKLGRRWVVGDDGRKAVLRPLEDLAPEHAIRWLRARAMDAAEAVVLDAPWPRPAEPSGREPELVPVEFAVHVADVTGPGLLALVEADDGEDPIEAWAGYYQRATPAQRRILDALLDAVRAGHSVAEARAVAAERLGISPATLRVQLHRLRRDLGG